MSNDKEGLFILLDYGAARLTGTGILLLTYCSISLEVLLFVFPNHETRFLTDYLYICNCPSGSDIPEGERSFCDHYRKLRNLVN